MTIDENLIDGNDVQHEVFSLSSADSKDNIGGERSGQRRDASETPSLPLSRMPSSTVGLAGRSSSQVERKEPGLHVQIQAKLDDMKRSKHYSLHTHFVKNWIREALAVTDPSTESGRLSYKHLSAWMGRRDDIVAKNRLFADSFDEESLRSFVHAHTEKGLLEVSGRVYRAFARVSIETRFSA